MKFKIDPELEALFIDLKISSRWTYEELKEDIKRNGIRESLTVSKDGIIVAGHQRYKISQELKIPDDKIPYIIKEFKNRQEMIDYAINDNLNRRNLNTYQRALLGLKLLPTYEKQAEMRKLGTLKKGMRPLIKAFNSGKHGSALERCSERVGISHMTLYKAREIEKSNLVTNEEKQKLIQGKTRIGTVYSRIKNEEKREKIQKEFLDDEQIRKVNQGSRFPVKLEKELTSDLNKHFIRCPSPNEKKAVKKKNVTIYSTSFEINGKTEQTKRQLSKFIHPGDKKIELKGCKTWDLSDIGYVIDLMKKIEPKAKISISKNKTLVFENSHFLIKVGEQ